MKRLFPLLLLLIWLLTLMVVVPAGRGVSQAGTVVRVAPETVSLSPGETTTIEIRVDDVVGLWAFAVDINFDPQFIEVMNLVAGGFLETSPTKHSIVSASIDEDEGHIEFHMFQIRYTDDDPEPREGSDVLFKFDIIAKSNPGISQFEIVQSLLGDRDGIAIDCTSKDGGVRVIGAVDDIYTIDRNQILQVPTPGVLANDVPPLGVVYQAELVTVLDPAIGDLSFNVDGSFTYTPPVDWAGTTGFTYRACNNENCTGPATVTINVVTVQGLRHWVYLPLILRH